jgi:uncharacterized protein YjiS (DUF1127 family)
MQMHTAQSLLDVHGLADAGPRQQPGSGLFSTLRSLATSLGAKVVAWQRYHRDIAELQRMDDRMLRDIGLTRFEIESAVRFGRRND